LKYDKKNSHGDIKYALLDSIGKSKVDVIVDNDMVQKAFGYYAS